MHERKASTALGRVPEAIGPEQGAGTFVLAVCAHEARPVPPDANSHMTALQGFDLVSQRVSIYFGADEEPAWYGGAVDDFDPDRTSSHHGLHRVRCSRGFEPVAACNSFVFLPA